jgi:positive regulator of sigma E activity
MLQCSATVTAVDADSIELDISPITSCQSCSEGFGCGMQLLDRSKSHKLYFSLRSLGLAHRGASLPLVRQRVALASSASLMLGASLRIYLLPLVSAVAAALTASMFSFGSISSDLMALLGLLGGLGAGLLVNRALLASSAVQLKIVPLEDTSVL